MAGDLPQSVPVVQLSMTQPSTVLFTAAMPQGKSAQASCYAGGLGLYTLFCGNPLFMISTGKESQKIAFAFQKNIVHRH